jgi:DNA-binding response OmpR family regulator
MNDDYRAESSAEAPAAPPPPLSIVALDDDADFREFVREALVHEGHEVRIAASPEAFYQVMEERLPDVVLLDMKMGRHSGEEVLLEIRKRWRKVCVIVVTGYPSLETMRQTFKQDVFDYLAKPFSMDELRHTLSQAATAFGLGGRPQDRLRMELGRQIRLTRAERGWTLKDLSEASGVSVSQLSSIERGAHLPSLESFLAVSEALGAQPSDWLKAAGF